MVDLPHSGWQLFAAETRTGRIIAELPFTDLAWSSPLNDIGRLTATIPVESYALGLGPWDDRDPRWVLREVLQGEWRYSLIAAYDRRAIWAGPLITSRPLSGEPGQPHVAVGASELPALLAMWPLIAPGASNPTDPSADTNLGPTSLANIALLLITQTQTSGPGFTLPLILPGVSATGDHVRNYVGADLASYWDRLKQLTEVAGGPDLRFDPILTADTVGELVQWEVRIGEPHLGDLSVPWTWDLGAGLRSVQADRDGSKMAFTAYVPGQPASIPTAVTSSIPDAAVNPPKPIGVASRTALISEGWPFLAAVDLSHTSTTDPVTLTAHAAAYVQVYSRATDTWGAVIDARSDPPLGVWSVGDTGQLDVRDQLLIEDGAYQRRIIGASGKADDLVTLTLAPTTDSLPSDVVT